MGSLIPILTTYRWSPGEIWPWRDHPVGGEGTPDFIPSLCNTGPFTIIREFEADMIMNFVLKFFNPAHTPEIIRAKWTEAQMDVWVANAIKVTRGQK